MPRLVPRSVHGALLATVLLASAAPAHAASAVVDRLVELGGCKFVDDEWMIYDQTAPTNPKPFGKAYADWTQGDVDDIKRFYLACFKAKPGWAGMNAQERQNTINYMQEKVGILVLALNQAHEARVKRAQDDADLAAQRQAAQARQDQQQQAAAAQQQQDAVQLRRATDLVDAMGQLASQAPTMPFADATAQIDDLVRRSREAREALPGDPVVAQLTQRETQLLQLRATLAANGPYTDLGQLVGDLDYSDGNPFLLAKFKTGLQQRGFDLQALANSITQVGPDWMVQLTGQATNPSTTSGFFCRVSGSDAASMAVLSAVSPPLTPVRVAGPLQTLDVDTGRQQVRLVIAPCTLKKGEM